ncbi:hypothetical protein JCM12294_45100 [Desulfocicer niacini]
MAAMEIYNKPNFHYREETFPILIVNARELILKARILQLDSNTQSQLTCNHWLSSDDHHKKLNFF